MLFVGGDSLVVLCRLGLRFCGLLIELVVVVSFVVLFVVLWLLLFVFLL